MTFRSLRSTKVSQIGLAVIVLASLVATAVFASSPSHNSSATSQASTLETLAKLREAWVQDLRTKRLEPILKSYAPDAAFLQPNGERIAGSAALRTLFQNIMSTFNSDLTLHSQNLETSGDLAYDSGDFEESLAVIAAGAKITSKGSYIIIYRRQQNGEWQIVQHVWTGTPPPGT
jgi:ketosteroid isomerase-like protein